MSLGEKIGMLRREKYWSQEELADRMEVSRQSVSKWESGASIPDIDKIVKLSDLFGVSLDYLLRDGQERRPDSEGLEEGENPWDERPSGQGEIPREDSRDGEEVFRREDSRDEDSQGGKKKKSGKDDCDEVRLLSADEAEGYLYLVERSAGWMAGAVTLCVISPVALLILLGMERQHIWGIGGKIAGGCGTVILLLVVCVAVAIFVLNAQTMSRYSYMERENIGMPDFAREEIVRKRQEFEGTYRGCLTAGVVLCVLSVVPLVGVAFTGIPAAVMYGVALLLLIVGLGVYWLVRAETIRGGYERLLQEGEYTEAEKRKNRRAGKFSSGYWQIVTIVYLLVSFGGNAWSRSWLIWPCAGILFSVVRGAFFGSEEKK